METPEADRTSLYSFTPPAPSTDTVPSLSNSVLHSTVVNNSGPVGIVQGSCSGSGNISAQSNSTQGSSSLVRNKGFLVQPGPGGFILVGFKSAHMAGTSGGSFPRYPEFWGKGDEDVEQHWYLCEAIWRSRATPEASKLVEFQTTLRGRALRWYIQFVDPPAGGETSYSG